MVRINVWLERQNLAARRELTMRERKERHMEGSLCSTSGAWMTLMATPWNPSQQHVLPCTEDGGTAPAYWRLFAPEANEKWRGLRRGPSPSSARHQRSRAGTGDAT
jgi:hypothetical protein